MLVVEVEVNIMELLVLVVQVVVVQEKRTHQVEQHYTVTTGLQILVEAVALKVVEVEVE
jgi:hypothetical protein